MENNTIKTTGWRRFSDGIHRYRAGGLFAQVRRVGRQWQGEVRWTDTGVIIRYAGLWGTLRDAKAETLDALGAPPEGE